MLPSLEIDSRVAFLTLRRPSAANKLTPEDLPELVRHVETVNRSPEVLVLVIRSEGKYFCSGYDISEIAASSQTEGSSFGDMVDALENCRAVTIAAVHGGVFGGATDLVLACDFRVGVRTAEMFMPAARLGLHYYQSGMERYVSRLGLDTAKRLFLTAEKLDGPAMRDCGFLTQLVDDAPALDAEVLRLRSTLAGMAPLALLGMKKHLNQIARGTADAASILREVQRTVASEDLAEGGRAWREKRPPVFKGR
ncbi:enoyl-CoA hydratase/isomerase family protein [Variovorax sp. 770b2]|uniref:enoyl-CoA hydratase/isomerase family protein n=1 Tax=Variovorax sp. 770b2 TaxID=1566271 RepID=UPI0008E15DCD|nr:enoyl-CoA hydratase/isomerase family protein [Variovorax sp. 770b2]SFP95183.1 Enoyl-CoA hydratase/carnithine racemase [Variovorax sp. 770b2]